MKTILQEVDRLLRGEFTDDATLRSGKVALPGRRLLMISTAFGVCYGLFMGLYGFLRPDNGTAQQLFASAVKVPLVFLATLFVTCPSLYVFSALAGSRCRAQETMKLLFAAIAINLAVLASFGPITAFFTFSTDAYPFMVLLNVFFFGVSGIIGLTFLRRALDAIISGQEERDARSGAEDEVAAKAETEAPPVALEGETAPDAAPAPAGLGPDEVAPIPGPARRHEPLVRGRGTPQSDAARAIFRVWIVIYGIVGCQMGWILRPFIGTPDREFEWFRPRTGSFATGLVKAITALFG
ncbi:MAG: hypothetical protein R3F20_10450 [Planctomycetota bacterium]